MTVNYY